MKVGLQISSFTWPGGPRGDRPDARRIVRDADDVGFDSIWVMDHFFQIRGVGRIEEPMLEGWTTLGFMAAHSKRARLGLMVGGVHYRNPGLWVKAATTLDVLSGGRAWLGIGAAWNEEESRGARLPVPAARRAVRDARGDAPDRPRDVGGRARHGGSHSTAGSSRPTRLLNSPQSLSRPRVPIMVGGGGEKKTLRLVAQYADACNVFGSPEGIARKYAILAEHCAAVGRDPDEIERSTLQNVRSRPTARRRHGDAAAGSSTASASCPTPAPSTSSSSMRRLPRSRRASTSSAATSSRSSARCLESTSARRYPLGVSASWYDDDP